MSLASEIVEGEICQYCTVPFQRGDEIYQEGEGFKSRFVGLFKEPMGFPCSCESCATED